MTRFDGKYWARTSKSSSTPTTNVIPSFPIKKIIRRIKQGGGRGLVCMVGVQTNQYPRALDMARQFRQADIPVAIGGFHVSGCLSMLPELTPDLQEALDLGVSLFAGEAEGRLDQVFTDAYQGKLEPIYNFIDDLPDLQGAVAPYLARSDGPQLRRIVRQLRRRTGLPLQMQLLHHH